jgi:hypothetical protein
MSEFGLINRHRRGCGSFSCTADFRVRSKLPLDREVRPMSSRMRHIALALALISVPAVQAHVVEP